MTQVPNYFLQCVEFYLLTSFLVLGGLKTLLVILILSLKIVNGNEHSGAI